MKYLFTGSSLALSVLFAVMLANAPGQEEAQANDSNSSDQSSMQQPSAQEQEPGTAASSDTATTTTTETHSAKVASSRSCTDENGNMFYKGKKGYKDCMQAKRKKEQMSGKAGSTDPEAPANTDHTQDTQSNQ